MQSGEFGDVKADKIETTSAFQPKRGSGLTGAINTMANVAKATQAAQAQARLRQNRAKTQQPQEEPDRGNPRPG